MRPLKVAFVTPNLVQNGVFHWIRDLAANTEVQRITWCGALITGPRAIDPSCAARLGRLMPLHCWYAASWSAAFDVADVVTTHFQPEDAFRALDNPDVVIAWELDQHLDWFHKKGIPVVLVSHSTWWYPGNGTTKQLAATAAVSEAAAEPFRRVGLEPTVIHSGLSWDRCASPAGRDNVRKFWRAGSGHFVTACLDRHTPEKCPGLLPYVLRTTDYHHLGVMYGADTTGSPANWLVEEMKGNERVFFHAPIENVGDVYAGADLIFTGSKQESFGQTLIEGIACGKPVLCREGLGVIPDLEVLSDSELVYKFRDDASCEWIGEFIEHLRVVPQDVRAAQEFVRDYLSARRGAARWTAYLESFRKVQIPVSAWTREHRYRWRTANRPFRGILLCRDYADLQSRLEFRRDDVLWVAGVVLDGESLIGQPQPRGIDVYTELTGPDWCIKHANLSTTIKRMAVTADFVLASVPLDVEQVYFEGTQIPSLHEYAEIDDLPTVKFRFTKPEVRAVFLCTPIGFGGTERWAEQLFERGEADGIKWVGCVSVDGTAHNKKLVAKFQALGVEVIDCGSNRQVAANAIARWKPDVLAYTGLERIGQCIPAGYSGPVVAVAHNSGYDYYTRAWAYSSDPFTSHSVAVSYLAALAFPAERREDVVVIYPGVKTCDHREDVLSIRHKELGFKVADVVICFAGRADANKRPELLAQAVAMLPPHYKFLHIGNLSEWDKPEPYLDMLKRILPGRYRWMEFSDDLDHLLAGVDMLVLCSKHESFGLVLMQALQQGCSVIGPTVSAVGEFHHDPNWAHTPWTTFDGDDPAVLAKTILDMKARPSATELPPVAKYFGADVAAMNFHQYLRETLKNPTGTGRKQLRQLRMSDIPIRPLPERTIVCDAVLKLSDDSAHNTKAATELLNQAKAYVVVHAVGSEDQLSQLRSNLSDTRLRYHESCCRSWLGAALACRDDLTSDFILDAAAGVANDPARAIRLVTETRDTGLEFMVDTTDASFDVGRTCFRKQTMIDFWLSGALCNSLADFQVNAIACGRNSRHASVAASRARYPATQPLFSIPGELPPLPGTVAVSVVLPFRGQVHWARAALESLLAQEKAVMTVYLVDDFSQSREADWFMIEARDMPGVKVFQTIRNIGQFMAVNAVLARESAKCWMIQDADDVSHSMRAWYTAHGLRESGSDIFTAAVLAFGGSMRVLEATYPYPGSWYFAINPVSGFTQGAFEQLGGYWDFNDTETNKASLDTDFFLRAAARDLKFYVSGRPLLYYRQHVDSCTGSTEIGIGSRKRAKLEQEITMRQVCETLRFLRGSYRACADLIQPFR